MFRFTCGERFKKIKKSQILYQDCLQNVIFLFMSLLTAPINKCSHISAGISFIFLKNSRPSLKAFQ